MLLLKTLVQGRNLNAVNFFLIICSVVIKRLYFQEIFPSADILVKYLQDFQRTLDINVQFNTQVHMFEVQPCSRRS